jgi:hypothetical protein
LNNDPRRLCASLFGAGKAAARHDAGTETYQQYKSTVIDREHAHFITPEFHQVGSRLILRLRFETSKGPVLLA